MLQVLAVLATDDHTAVVLLVGGSARVEVDCKTATHRLISCDISRSPSGGPHVPLLDIMGVLYLLCTGFEASARMLRFARISSSSLTTLTVWSIGMEAYTEGHVQCISH